MKIYALICHKLDLTQFWPEVVSWRFEITTDDVAPWRLELGTLFVFSTDGLKNAGSLLTPVSSIVFDALSHSTLGF